jgi:acyl-CoA synthetase (NDP forming)
VRIVADATPSGSAVPRAGSPLAALFEPRAIAILGASGREGNPFARPLEFLFEYGFDGTVYPVNPGYPSLRGVPCFPSLEALPEPVDLVLMMVSAEETVRQLPAVGRAGAAAAIVFASGFAETGPAGQRLQDDLVATARAAGVRLLGPNCQGVVSVHHRMAATFTAAVESGLPPDGNVAYVGQSGAVGGSILSLARERGLGIASWASTGNQADLDALEIGRHLIEDERIDVLAMYLESTVDGARYGELARRAQELGASVLVLQSGLSAAGRRAAVSHTGAIIGGNAAFRAMSHELGVVEADDVEDFLATAHALSVLPRARGRRVGIVTTSGGAGSLAADQAEHAGLTVDPLTEQTQQALSAVVPDFGAVANPVDVTAQLFRSGRSDAFVEVCELVLSDPTVDVVLVALTMVTGVMATQMADDLAAVWRTAEKPVLVVWLAAREQTVAARATLRDQGWPVLDSPQTAMRVLRALATTPAAGSRSDGGRGTSRAPQPEVQSALDALEGPVVTEAAGERLLTALDVARPQQRLLRSAEEAAEAGRRLTGSLVLKIQSPTVLHKTERGGVRLDVAPEDVSAVYDQLVESFSHDQVEGVLVQQLVGPGPELIVGVTNTEPTFPPLVTVGVGGIATELYRDTVTRLAPVDEREALEMLSELRAAPLLTGMRGMPGTDLGPAAAAIARLSGVADLLGPRLEELEVNPLRLADGGRTAVALDFLLRLADLPSDSPVAPALDTDREDATP